MLCHAAVRIPRTTRGEASLRGYFAVTVTDTPLSPALLQKNSEPTPPCRPLLGRTQGGWSQGVGL
jgi:hypothetical protein